MPDLQNSKYKRSDKHKCLSNSSLIGADYNCKSAEAKSAPAGFHFSTNDGGVVLSVKRLSEFQRRKVGFCPE